MRQLMCQQAQIKEDRAGNRECPVDERPLAGSVDGKDGRRERPGDQGEDEDQAPVESDLDPEDSPEPDGWSHSKASLQTTRCGVWSSSGSNSIVEDSCRCSPRFGRRTSWCPRIVRRCSSTWTARCSTASTSTCLRGRKRWRRPALSCQSGASIAASA